MRFNLPFPPSVNTYYRKYRNVMVLSDKGKAFKQEVALQLAGVPRFADKRLSVVMTLHAPNKRKYDIDNRLKAMLDAMQSAKLFDDDEQIDRLEVTRGEIIKGGMAVIEVTEIEND